MVLQRYDKDTPVEDLMFNRTSFWVQVHDIPIRFMNQKVAEGICSTVGTVIRKPDTEVDGGGFMRVKVSLDITRPLSKGRMVSLGQGKEQWVSFKYERLPNICYWCGCLNHDDRDCELWLDSEGSLKVEELQYGPWLRAAPVSRARKNVVSVPGFFKKVTEGGKPFKRTPDIIRRAPLVSETTPSPPVATQDREEHHVEHHVENSMNQVSGSVTFNTNKSSPIFAQQQKQNDPLVHQIEELDRALKNFDLPINEERPGNPSAVFTELNSPQNSSNPMLSPSETLPTDSFLSKTAKVGEGISILRAVSNKINEPLNTKFSLNVQSDHAIKGQSKHVINGDTKETARVCQGQGSAAHATQRADTSEK